MSAILDLWRFLKEAHVRQGKLCDIMKSDFHLSWIYMPPRVLDFINFFALETLTYR